MPLTPFLIDENTDVQIARFLAEKGHEIIDAKKQIGEGTVDSTLVVHALRHYAVIVTRNHRHFAGEASMAMGERRKQHRHWGLLSLTCSAAVEVRRVKHLYEVILYEIEQGRRRYPDTLLLQMEIHDRSYTIHY